MKIALSVVLSFFGIVALASDPFGVSFSALSRGGVGQVRISVTVPPGHHLYADQIEAALEDGSRLRQESGDKPVRLHDSFSDSYRDSFTNSFIIVYGGSTALVDGASVKFTYQGCSDQECFFPRTQTYRMPSMNEGTPVPMDTGEAPPSIAVQRGWERTGTSHFISAHASGYLNASDFLAFLDRAEGRSVEEDKSGSTSVKRIKAGFFLFSDDPVKFLNVHGVWLTVLLILIGGLLLNLTPCVLPMIPINLAILGVGSQNSTRGRGFLLGAAYGFGISVVYGVLGLVVVLTGSQFGALNSLPWFNAVIGSLFVVLALAMFDFLAIDLTRFQSGAVEEPGKKRGGVIPAVIMGGVAALLAGACVAPVVIAVLLLSGNLYAHGAGIGLVLPFVLGLGMAMPWPLAGAGLTFLPKPGTWMTWVKYGFGVFILIFAVYYYSLAFRGWRGAGPDRQSEAGVSQLSVMDQDKWNAILSESSVERRPVFVDFWATWCKNCEAMELTTFQDAAVRKRLSGYKIVKFQVEKLTESEALAVTEYFEIKGLPTYLVLTPGKKP